MLKSRKTIFDEFGCKWGTDYLNTTINLAIREIKRWGIELTTVTCTVNLHKAYRYPGFLCLG